jgi:HrpA-like RNA helicase
LLSYVDAVTINAFAPNYRANSPKISLAFLQATNIAETSVTVSDIVYVVDSGRVKENRIDEIKEAPALVDCWVSKASAQQRRGRAGRVRPGVAFHLFSSHTYDNVLQSYQICEMSRVGIENLVLQVLILDLGDPCSVLARAITPPSAIAMRNSLKLLEELGAIECQWQSSFDESATCASLTDTKTELTPLGFHLATLPVDPRIGKVIIYGALFSCIEPALTIAAAMSSKSPFISSFENREAADRARATLSIEGSDHLTILNAFDIWKTTRMAKGERAASKFVRDNFLSWHTLVQLEEIRHQLFALLCDIGFLPSTCQFKGDKSLRNLTDDAANVNANNMDLVKGVLCAGMYPNIIVAPRSLVNGRGNDNKQAAGEIAFRSRSKGEVYLHPSVLSYSSKKMPSRYCCYHEIMQTRKLYVRDVTVVSPFALLLFGGTLQVYHTDGVITIDTWLQFRISRVAATLIKYLRSEMETMLLQKIVSPGQNLTVAPHNKAITDAICTLFLEKLPVDTCSSSR